MLANIASAILDGIKGRVINIEVDVSKGMPCFIVVGLPDMMIRESKERIKSAILNMGFEFSYRKITINLWPASTKKAGTHLDLPIAVSYLLASNQIVAKDIEDYGLLGELNLSGELVKINGVISLVESLKRSGVKHIVVPAENAIEAGLIEGVNIYGVKKLSEVVLLLESRQFFDTIPETPLSSRFQSFDVDFSDVKGQLIPKRALEIAAAGFHNLVMIGAPGCGKTMLASRLITIMPEISKEEALETTSIFSVAGELRDQEIIIDGRPFRSLTSNVTKSALLGGGRYPKPGEVSLANNGILFLDELPEFSKELLDALRVPLSNDCVHIRRNEGVYEYPTKFLLVCAMNPCKCGNFGSNHGACTCSDHDVKRYLNRLSGPFLDRLDMFVEMNVVAYDELTARDRGEMSSDIRKRVEGCKAIQTARFSEENARFNGQMNEKMVKRYCVVSAAGKKVLEQAYKNLKLTARGYSKILKVSRTIADMNNSEIIEVEHLLEALQYRNVRESYWV